MPLYCEPSVEARIRKSFDYAFISTKGLHAGAVPKIEIRPLGLEAFEVLGYNVQPLRLKHGPRFDVLGFRFGQIAYCTDTNGIPPESMEKLQGLEVLVLDCLGRKPHATHFCLEESLAIAAELKPRRTLLTHLSHGLSDEISESLPEGVELAYDGLSIPLE